MILCCGEALIDMLPEGEGFMPHAGGAVFNTAVALGRLGAPAGFFSGLSNDLFGARLSAALEASKVDTAFCARSNRPTTLAFVTLTNGQASYAFYDENTAGRLLAPEDLPALPADVSTLFFGGISLVSEPAADTYATLMEREAASCVTMLDPNIRPGFITDPARYRDRIGRMIVMADIIKISDEDLHWLEGQGDPVALAKRLLAKGPKLVLLTEGARGARALTATQERFVAAPKVTVADTVGAGDTFNAGVLAALEQAGALVKGADWSDDLLDTALGLGTRAAAVTVSRAGANPPWASEL
ncbi:carbohydrate kinase family protein [Falsirhodobacter sp. 20TX0035]|uniref:carbohydrate kinase family protein n=1 Tax=Falsirhodobacter sp. 20TX0035 TaxID=3022019 RepID=UPI00232D9D12|nr:carbohydrate kinase [Falsirhodobacter sp. 20TX0035]MDB6453279.1 carbohydrate kinase [Falsirhodobacter sp. 20TX0035]